MPAAPPPLQKMSVFERFSGYERRIAAGIAQPPETEITLTDVVMIGLVGLVAVATCLLAPDHDHAND